MVYNDERMSFFERMHYIMNITEYTVERVTDPTGILIGERYEFFLNIEMPEDDKLYEEKGLQLKVLYYVDDNQAKMLNYFFYASLENKYLDFELEEEEEQLVTDFCKTHYHEAE
jgi:hypothetical protein